MALGGFAPCPLPLGGTAVDGLTAEQHARIAADLKAAVQGAPFAVYGLNFTSSLLESYVAQYGVGVSAMPLVASGGVGIWNFTWQPSYEDEYGNVYPTNIRHAIVSQVWTGGVPAWCSVEITSPTTLSVYTTNNAHVFVTEYFTLAVW